MARLEGKIALITGGGSGIGRATAMLFAREAAQVSVVDWDRAAGEETVALIRASGGRALFVPTDVTDAEQVEAAKDAFKVFAARKPDPDDPDESACGPLMTPFAPSRWSPVRLGPGRA